MTPMTNYPSAFITLLPPSPNLCIFFKKGFPFEAVPNMSMHNMSVFTLCMNRCVCCRSEQVCHMQIWMHGIK